MAFFAYPGRAEPARGPWHRIGVLAGPREDAGAALEALADALDAPRHPAGGDAAAARLRRGPARRRPRSAPAIAALLPEGAIVVDESVTASAPIVPPRPARRRTTGSRSPAARSARACRSPPAPPSRARTGPC